MLLLFNKRHTLCIRLFVLFITISWHRYTPLSPVFTMVLNHVISHTPYPPSSHWIHVFIYKSFRLEQNHFTCDEVRHTFSHSCLGDYETKWSRAEHRFGGIWKDYGWCKWIILATIREPLRPNYNFCVCWIRSDAIYNVCLIFTSSANVCLKYFRYYV